jgi:ABC-2 type transport system permease protein
MAAFHILRRDLLRYLRNPGRTALLFAIPLMMAGIFALVFGGGGEDGGITIRVLLWDEDSSLLGRLLQGAGDRPESEGRLEVVPVGQEGLEMMNHGDASALVHLPKGFTRAVIDGTPAVIEVIKNPAQRFLPLVVEEGVILGATVLSTGSRALRPELDVISSFLDADDAPEDAAVGALSASFNRRAKQFDSYVFPPVVKLEAVDVGASHDEETAASPQGIAAVLSVFLPGFAILGVLFLAQSATRDMLHDRETGVVRQLLTAPVTPVSYLVGKCLSVLVVSAVGLALLVAAGAAAGVAWGSPVAVVAVIVTAAIAASGTLLLVMSVVGSERQGDAVATVVIMSWCMLGGAFVPLSQMPTFLHPIAKTTLVYWATTAFSTLIAGGDIADVLPNLAVLAGGGALGIAIGAAVMGRRLARGAL